MADGKRRWDAGIRAGVISAVVGVLALIVALLTWLLPREPGGHDPAGKPATTGAATTGPATTGAARPVATGAAAGTGTADPAAATYLNSQAPEEGAADLVAVPRPIKGKDGYTGQEIAVRCPSNETGDTTSDVTYPLLGRYAQFDATVHPYYPAGTDQKGAAYLTALIAVKRTDGDLDTRTVGAQKTATPAAAAALSVPVDGAEKLTLRIECGNPNGVVVLTGARLTSAGG